MPYPLPRGALSLKLPLILGVMLFCLAPFSTMAKSLFSLGSGTASYDHTITVTGSDNLDGKDKLTSSLDYITIGVGTSGEGPALSYTTMSGTLDENSFANVDLSQFGTGDSHIERKEWSLLYSADVENGMKGYLGVRVADSQSSGTYGDYEDDIEFTEQGFVVGFDSIIPQSARTGFHLKLALSLDSVEYARTLRYEACCSVTTYKRDAVMDGTTFSLGFGYYFMVAETMPVMFYYDYKGGSYDSEENSDDDIFVATDEELAEMSRSIRTVGIKLGFSF